MLSKYWDPSSDDSDSDDSFELFVKWKVQRESFLAKNGFDNHPVTAFKAFEEGEAPSDEESAEDYYGNIRPVVTEPSEAVAAKADDKGKGEENPEKKPESQAEKSTSGVPSLDTTSAAAAASSDAATSAIQKSPRADIVSPRSVAASKFSKVEMKNITSGKIPCMRCKKPFSLFRAPDRCGKCALPVCSKCSYVIPHVPQLLDQKGATTCNACWKQVAKELEETAKKNSELSALVESDLSVGNKFLLADPERRVTKVELDILQNHPDSAPDDFFRSKTCCACDRGFTLFRSPTKCLQCERFVCTGAACSMRCAPLPSRPVSCRECWPASERKLKLLQKDQPELTEEIAMTIALGQRFLVEIEPGQSVLVSEEIAKATRAADKSVMLATFNQRKKEKDAAEKEAAETQPEKDSDKSSEEKAASAVNDSSNASSQVGPLAKPGVQPHALDISKGPKYICRCGQSATYPLCDGSHGLYNEKNGTMFSPWIASKEDLKEDTVYVCGCGMSKKRLNEGIPLCDGTHMSLSEEEKKRRLEALGGEGGGGADASSGEVDLGAKKSAVLPVKQLPDSCSVCSQGFDGRFVREKECSECERAVCSNCVGFYKLHSLKDVRPRHICTECLAPVKRKVEAVIASDSDTRQVARARKEAAALAIAECGNLTAPSAQGDFTPEEVEKMQQGELKCNYSDEPFTMCRAPLKCSECKLASSAYHAHDFSDVSVILGGRAKLATYCRKCWPSIRKRLEVAAQDEPEVAERANRQIAIGKLLLEGMEDITNPLEGEEVPNKCPECRKAFSLFRTPEKCSVSGAIVCTGVACSGRFWIEGNEEGPQRVSFSKLSEVKSRPVPADRNVVAHAGHLFDVDKAKEPILGGAKKAPSIASVATMDVESRTSITVQMETTKVEVTTEKATKDDDETQSNESSEAEAGGDNESDPDAKCNVCTCTFDAFRREKSCSECNSRVCNQCVGFFRLRSLNDSRPRYICFSCLPEVHKQVLEQTESGDSGRAVREAAAVDILVAGNLHQHVVQGDFTKEESAQIKKGQLDCAVSKEPFTHSNVPRKCTECERCVGGKDARNFDWVARILERGRPSCVCRDCWPTVRNELVTAAENNESLKSRVVDEISVGDEFFSRPRDSFPEAPTDFPSKCSSCAKRYNKFRIPQQCRKCSNSVCTGVACSGKFVVPEFDNTTSSVICATCLSSVELDKLPRGALSSAQELGPTGEAQEALRRKDVCPVTGEPFSYWDRPVFVEDRNWLQSVSTCTLIDGKICGGRSEPEVGAKSEPETAQEEKEEDVKKEPESKEDDDGDNVSSDVESLTTEDSSVETKEIPVSAARTLEPPKDYSLTSWYPHLKDFTMPTAFVPLTQEEMRAMVNVSAARSADEEPEADQLEALKDLEARLDRMIKEEFAGQVFVKITTRSPKDVMQSVTMMDRLKTMIKDNLHPWEFTDDTKSQVQVANQDTISFVQSIRKLFKITNGKEALDVLQMSDRVRGDMEKALASEGEETVTLCIRAWRDVDAGMEFRVFIHEKKLTAVSQYCYYQMFDTTYEQRDAIKDQLQTFFDKMLPVFPYESTIMDVHVGPDKVELIEMNPFKKTIGACMFSWKNEVDVDIIQEGPFEIRVLEKPKSNPYSCLPSRWKHWFQEERGFNLSRGRNKAAASPSPAPTAAIAEAGEQPEEKKPERTSDAEPEAVATPTEGKKKGGKFSLWGKKKK